MSNSVTLARDPIPEECATQSSRLEDDNVGRLASTGNINNDNIPSEAKGESTLKRVTTMQQAASPKISKEVSGTLSMPPASSSVHVDSKKNIRKIEPVGPRVPPPTASTLDPFVATPDQKKQPDGNKIEGNEARMVPTSSIIDPKSEILVPSSPRVERCVATSTLHDLRRTGKECQTESDSEIQVPTPQSPQFVTLEKTQDDKGRSQAIIRKGTDYDVEDELEKKESPCEPAKVSPLLAFSLADVERVERAELAVQQLSEVVSRPSLKVRAIS